MPRAIGTTSYLNFNFNFSFNFYFIHSISIYNFTIASTRVQESLIEAREETHKFKEKKGKKKHFANSTRWPL